MLSPIRPNFFLLHSPRAIHTSSVLNKNRSARQRPSKRGDKPLTYEEAWQPRYIGTRKAWNSWNTSNLSLGFKPPGNIWQCIDLYDWHPHKPKSYKQDLIDAHRGAETAIEDIFIRRFFNGTWHGLVLSEVIIKRQHNHIRIAAIIRQSLIPRKMYFLIGYCEELLAYWLQCPVTLELQTTPDKKDVVFKYI